MSIAAWGLLSLLAIVRGAVVRSIVSDLVQRNNDQTLDDARVEQLVTVDFDACQLPFSDATGDRVRLLLNLTDGRSVPVWLNCRGVFYETPIEPIEFLPLRLRLHEHMSCEGDVVNMALAQVARTSVPRAKTVYELVAASFWRSGLTNGTSAGARRRLLQSSSDPLYATVPGPGAASPLGGVLVNPGSQCTQPPSGGCDDRHYHPEFIRQYRQTYLDVTYNDLQKRTSDAEVGRTLAASWNRDGNWSWQNALVEYNRLRLLFEHEHELAAKCLVPMLCTGGDVLPGYAEPQVHQKRALELHHTQARLRLATAPYKVWINNGQTYQNYKVADYQGQTFSDEQKRKMVLDADLDRTNDTYKLMQEQDRMRQLVAFQPIDGRAACSAVQARFWEESRRQGVVPAHVLNLTGVSFIGDSNAPADPPPSAALRSVTSARDMYRWLQAMRLAPTPPAYPNVYQDQDYTIFGAKQNLPRSQAGYPTQWQWDPPCREVNAAYNATHESVTCRGSESSAPGPNALYPRVFASDNRCKFTPNMTVDTQEAYSCVPAQVYAADAAAYWSSSACATVDEKTLYCALAADGGVPTSADDVAAKCFGGSAEAFRRALVESLWVLLDDEGGGFVERQSGEPELDVYRRYFCKEGSLKTSQFWFRSAGNSSDVNWLRNVECPCAESTNEGLKVCPVNPWERLAADGRLRTHGQLQACVRNRGRSYCSPLLDFRSLRAETSNGPATVEDKCNSPFMTTMGDTTHYSGSQLYALLLFAHGQIQSMEKVGFNCSTAHQWCSLPSAGEFSTEAKELYACYDVHSIFAGKCATKGGGTAPLGDPDCKQDCLQDGSIDDRQYLVLRTYVDKCFGKATTESATTAGAGASALAEVRAVPNATCTLKGGAPSPLPSFNRLLLTKETYDFRTGGTLVSNTGVGCTFKCADKTGYTFEPRCKPNFVTSQTSQTLRLTVAKAALDVAANAAALENFVAELTGQKAGNNNLTQIAQEQVKNMEAQVKALNLSADINDWLNSVQQASLENMQKRLKDLSNGVADYTGRFDQQSAKIEGHFAELSSQLTKVRAQIARLDEGSGQAVAELRQLAEAVDDALNVTAGLMLDFAAVMGKSAANSVEVAALARRLLYGRQRYVGHVHDVQEELALTDVAEVPFLPTTPYDNGTEYGVAPRKPAGAAATAPAHEMRLWQSFVESSVVWVVQVRLLQLCDLRWVQDGLYQAGGGLDVAGALDAFGPPKCRLGTLSDQLRCLGCRLRVTAKRCPTALSTPDAASARWFHNTTWLRLDLARRPLGSSVCAQPAIIIPRSAVKSSVWAAATLLSPVVAITSNSWGQQTRPPGTAVGPEHETAEDLEADVVGLDLASPAEIRALLTALCQGPAALLGTSGNWSGRPLLAASFGPTAEQSALYNYWNLAGTRASAPQLKPELSSVQQMRELLVCDSNVRTARSLATLHTQIQADPAQFLTTNELYMGQLPATLSAEDRPWLLTPHPLSAIVMSQWADGVRRLANSPLSSEFRYADEGLLPPLGLRTEFSQRAPPPPDAVAGFVSDKPSLWSNFKQPTAANTNATNTNATNTNATVPGPQDIAFANGLAEVQALVDEINAAGSSNPAALEDEELQLLRQNDVPTDLVNCYRSSWLTHGGRAIRLHRVGAATAPRVELAVELDRNGPELAGLGAPELLRLEQQVSGLRWELIDHDIGGAGLLGSDWYYAGEPECALNGNCTAPAPDVGPRHVVDVDPDDVCQGESAHMRASRAAGGVCLNTVRLPVAAARNADRRDGTWDMFSFEDFYRHEHGSLAHPQPAADDFDPRLALLAPVQLARSVTKVDGRLFCARAPGTVVRRPCAVLQDFELQAKAGGRLSWRAASGRGRVTAQLHVPTNMTATAGGGGQSSTTACPRQASVALPGTADMALEFWSTAVISAQVAVRGGRGWCNSTLPPALRLAWPLVTPNCTDPAEVRLLVGGALCFVWQAAAAITPGPDQALLRSSYSSEQALLLGQIANLSVASLQVQSEWQQLVTRSMLEYGSGWVTRSALGVWVPENVTNVTFNATNLLTVNATTTRRPNATTTTRQPNATTSRPNATARRRLAAAAAGDPFAPTKGAGSDEDAAAALDSLAKWSAGQAKTIEELTRERGLLDTRVSDLQALIAELERNWSVFETAFRNANGTNDEVWSFLGSLGTRVNDTKCLLDAMGVGANAVSPGQLANLSSNFEAWQIRYASGDQGAVREIPPLRAKHNRGLAIGLFVPLLLLFAAGWGWLGYTIATGKIPPLNQCCRCNQCCRGKYRRVAPAP